MARRSNPKTPARALEAAPAPKLPTAEALAPAEGGGAPDLQLGAPVAQPYEVFGAEEAMEFGRLAMPEIGPEQIRLFANLSAQTWADLTLEARRTLTEMVEAAITDLSAAQTAIEAQGLRFLNGATAETLEVRSRDGKPFRRAGFLFGDAWQHVQTTPEQAERIRADKALQIKAAD